MKTIDKIAALRRAMKKAGIHAYLVPGTDPHQSEYPPACWERRAWMSGFSGSAGELVVTRTGAALWTDGRYFLQAEEQLEGSGIELCRMGQPGVPTVEAFLCDALRKGQSVGLDPRTVSVARASGIERAVGEKKAALLPLEDNLVDRVWADQPPMPSAPLSALGPKFCGEKIASKLKRIRAAMTASGASSHVVTTLDAIAWLFNIRGRDVDFNPVAIAYAIVTQTTATLYVEPSKVTPAVRRQFGLDVNTADYADFGSALTKLSVARGVVWLDGATTSRWVVDRLGNADTLLRESPIARMKARKNHVELAGMRAAHVRDGVALTRFLAWLDANVGVAPVTERSAATHLRSLRAEGEHFQGLSFPTISGYGPHGAIIHYSVSEETDVPLKPKGLYLVDSGAQYLDGTTDVTRTIALGGKVTRAERDAYTRVLKGHIALARAKFPVGSTGARLDTLARQHLWQAGLDYNHGTGHGVGAYLNVHEGPQSISPRTGSAPLEPGNIQSNEPGYYRPGAFGIRIENLVEVVPANEGGDTEREFLALETLTLSPIDIRPVDVSMLDETERRWLNAYHRRVNRTLGPLLDRPTRRWLTTACRPI
jgi:Xaa-Pro aminopeptidase